MTKHSTELPVAVLDETGLAVSAGWLTVYSVDPTTREYQSALSEYLQIGVGLPAYSFADKPPVAKAGFALVRSLDGKTWGMVSDLRGQTVYSVETGLPEKVTTIGALGAGLTRLAPVSSHDKWDGKKWVTDKVAEQEAAQAEQAQLQQTAEAAITRLERASRLGMATAEGQAALSAWEIYSVLLNRVDINRAPAIKWPTVPTSQ